MPDFLYGLQWKIYEALQPRTWWYQAKHLYQRMRRGWSYRDVWRYDVHTALVIAEGAEHLRKVSMSHPPTLTPEDWDEILQAISRGFRIWAESPDYILNPEDQRAYVYAKQLFIVWHQDLWW